MSNVISIEELREDLEEQQKRKDDILTSLKELFDNAGFEYVEDKNTLNFEDTHEDLKALFSIYDTTFDYSAYITSESDNSMNYSLKGNIDGIEEAAEKFLAEYNDILTLDISQKKLPEDDEIEIEDEILEV